MPTLATVPVKVRDLTVGMTLVNTRTGGTWDVVDVDVNSDGDEQEDTGPFEWAYRWVNRAMWAKEGFRDVTVDSAAASPAFDHALQQLHHRGTIDGPGLLVTRAARVIADLDPATNPAMSADTLAALYPAWKAANVPADPAPAPTLAELVERAKRHVAARTAALAPLRAEAERRDDFSAYDEEAANWGERAEEIVDALAFLTS